MERYLLAVIIDLLESAGRTSCWDPPVKTQLADFTQASVQSLCPAKLIIPPAAASWLTGRCESGVNPLTSLSTKKDHHLKCQTATLKCVGDFEALWHFKVGADVSRPCANDRF